MAKVTEVRFKSTKKETAIIGHIVDRAMIAYKKIAEENGDKLVCISAIDMMMDIEATHCNGCRLNLEGLLAADEFNFLHDISGIRHNINRRTGKLENCFLPRFALRETSPAKKSARR